MKLRTRQFGLRVIRLVRALEKSVVGSIIGRQLLRSETSVGANYRAVCRARSDREFVAKLSIVIEESDESAYWLELIIDDEMLPKSQVEALLQESNELTAMMVSSRKTALSRMKQPKTDSKSEI